MNKKPGFARQNKRYKKRVGDSWRKPRGIDNKQRVEKRGFGALPRAGYGSAAEKKGLHPTGVKEKLAFSVKGLVPGFAARIGGSVGRKKKAEIIEAARKKGIKVLNA
ncbi:50S ribosomal protein L32e [Candidatus Micrarchaeota archaeon CG_4_10_14_0_2_um_filter_55_9]|nr:MAG: hypothetical protein AUJ15_00335 [Candidatus Micrarchaeota archaeon CG1_02_55_41]PIO02560.1 MAG: 50S ribosomal protein L32e [Candidatus Micrarchaeota archaeon CG09_land_8_20_14_0_10_55_25]PIZ91568.1 MAG: 50S ribosomal protein L32e [Candidatus Micrarchaeota archaeon CG_4_10_14_0_2_um_filter_55_9]PJD01013.1 MAG: 50S ribosomal protein L32e [Candidatus Micrarchaeota archaeon CG10_big_fil_rev_8_21_14_0_10_54_18]